MNHPKIIIRCLICNEYTGYVNWPGVPQAEICDKCKAAVLKMRENLEHDPCQPILD